jgi:hypothetical protein
VEEEDRLAVTADRSGVGISASVALVGRIVLVVGLAVVGLGGEEDELAVTTG